MIEPSIIIEIAADLEGREPPPAPPRDLYFVRREGGPAYGGLAYEALIRSPAREALLQGSTVYAPAPAGQQRAESCE